jgi:hypothetical protein
VKWERVPGIVGGEGKIKEGMLTIREGEVPKGGLGI